MSADRLLGAMGAILIGTYFFRLVRPSLHVYFSPDDLMNLQVSWTQSLASLVRANLLFFESSIFGRPLGSVWYRAIYHLAGLNPVPFHAANLVILALNIALAFALARRLSGSPETGAIAALLFCYRPQMAYLYFNTGFIYDVLCCFFYLAALLLYVEVRRRGMLPGLGGLAGLCVLYILALNSKEMAVTFPVILTTYELLYHRPSLSSFRHWPMREGRAIVVTGIMTLAFVIGRIAGAQSLTKFEAYRPHISLAQYMATSGRFFGLLTEAGDWRPWQIVLFWLVIFAGAWAARSRTARFAAVFMLFSPLPLVFVFPRGPSQYYVCWFGWCLYGAAAIVGPARRLTSRSAAGLWAVRARGAILLLVLIAIQYPQFKRRVAGDVAAATFGAPENLDYVRQLHNLEPRLPPRSRLLFLNDPFPADWWNLLFVVQLSYGDVTLDVKRVKQGQETADPAKFASYDYVFDFQDGRFAELQSPSAAAAVTSPE